MDQTKSDISNFNNLVKKLNNYRNKLNKIDYIRDKKLFFELMRDFRRYIPSVKNKKICNMLIHSEYFSDFQKFFSERNLYYLRALESIQAISIITRSISLKESFIDLIDIELIKESYEMKLEEIKSIDFLNAKTLVAVWTWSMPETLLYFYENTSLENIIWLDNNHEAIYIAWEMINWLHLDKIKLYRTNFSEYDYKDVDIVYIPLFIIDKNKILDRIIETWKKDIQIIVNVWKWLWMLVYEDLININPRLKIVYRKDTYNKYITQEVIKLEKYNF